MFIKLHHKESGGEFFIPASHVVIIDGKEKEELSKFAAPGEKAVKTHTTYVHTVIMKGPNTLTFEVRESPEEVATLVNEMLNTAARASKMN